MQQQIDTLIETIKADYETWMLRGRVAGSNVTEDMIERFNANIDYSVGKKYIKVLNGNGSVWGFVVNTDTDKKFRKGDILKAAGWNAPARNAARGNIVDGGYIINWTGPLYL